MLSIYVPAVINCGTKNQLENAIQVIISNAKKPLFSSVLRARVKSIDNTEWICNTCHLNIKEGKLPQCSKVNGMSFPNEPSVLGLTPLEERLISP